MSRRLVVGPKAERELVAAALWYEERQEGLGRAFVEEVLRGFEEIVAGPETFPVLALPYRRKLLNRFPFAIIYKVTEVRIYVRAVAHGKRRPGYWQR